MNAPASQPRLPDTLRHLTDDEGARLRKSGRRAWSRPSAICLTCNKHEKSDPAAPEATRYLWYAQGSRRQEDVVEYQCRCTDQYQLFRWMANAGLGMNYMRTSWDDALQMEDAAMDAALDYAANSKYHVSAGNNLMFFSPRSGTGKTFLAAMLTKKLLLEGTDAFFATFPDILDLYSVSWRLDEERAVFNDRVRSVPVLVIDDLGREHPGRSGVAEAMLDAILRSRIADCLPTVVTTNLSAERRASYGDNLVSLLKERMIIVEVGGVDKRDMMLARTHREHELSLSRPIVMT